MEYLTSMPDQFIRLVPLMRLVSLLAAVLLAAQVTLAPAAAATVAAPVRTEDELPSAPAEDDAGLAAEPVADESELAAEGEPAAAEGEPVAAEGEPAAAEGEPVADEGSDLTDDGAPIADVPAEDGEPASAAEPEVVEEHAPADEMAADQPADVQEAPAEVEFAFEPAAEPEPLAAAAPVLDDPVADAFLLRLLDAINARRARNGTQQLTYVPARANTALDGFLAETVGEIGWPGPCMHLLVDGAFSWDYVQAAGFGGEARGEVIACPGPEPYWTPDRAAEQWWDSPIHHDVLYADPDANALACSAYGVRSTSNGGGRRNRDNSGSADAASAVLCVTFRG